MKKIAKFEKVSFEQFRQDFKVCSESYMVNYSEEDIEKIYNDIELPTRATKGSAGYDFKMPTELCIDKSSEYIIPTGIRVKINDGWVLSLYPRSGLGFKYKMKLNNTVGIIDSDYYFSGNEGHIMAKISYEAGANAMLLQKGQGFVQGIFTEYGVTEDDDANTIRDGGFGSTDK